MWFIVLLGAFSARQRYRPQRQSFSWRPLLQVPGVSILRPLKGLDTNLYENLESTFKQDYPNYEILFSVADEQDGALPIVRELITRYPNVNAEIVIGEQVVGVNPKVNNLIRSYHKAAHDIIWALDSNVSVDPGTLGRSVDSLNAPLSPSQKPIGLVHHVPFAFCNESHTGSRIEAAFLNTTHAKMYIAINTVAIESCVVGKSNIFRRSDLERVDGSLRPRNKRATPQPTACGLHVFGRFLAEDNMIASALWHELGLRHELSCDVAHNAVGNMSLSDYFWRRVRWIRVRRHMVLTATLLEPFTESVMLCIIGSCSIGHLFGFPSWIFAPMHFAFWLLVDLDVYASLAGRTMASSVAFDFIVAWVAREMLTLPIWVWAMLGSEVSWRGTKYQMLRNGEVRPSLTT